MSIIQKCLARCGFAVDDETNITEIERALVAMAALISDGKFPVRNVGALPTVGAINDVTVGATTTAVLAASATRERVMLANETFEKMYIAVGTAAISGKGICLDAGDSIVLTPDDGCKLAINAICASGGKTLIYQTLATA